MLGLSNADFGIWCRCLLMASSNDPRGTLPPVEYMSRLFGVKPHRMVDYIKRLMELHLVDAFIDGQKATAAQVCHVDGTEVAQESHKNGTRTAQKWHKNVR